MTFFWTAHIPVTFHILSTNRTAPRLSDHIATLYIQFCSYPKMKLKISCLSYPTFYITTPTFNHSAHSTTPLPSPYIPNQFRAVRLFYLSSNFPTSEILSPTHCYILTVILFYQQNRVPPVYSTTQSLVSPTQYPFFSSLPRLHFCLLIFYHISSPISTTAF